MSRADLDRLVSQARIATYSNVPCRRRRHAKFKDMHVPVTMTTRPVRSGIWSTLKLDLGGKTCARAGSFFLNSESWLPMVGSRGRRCGARHFYVRRRHKVGMWQVITSSPDNPMPAKHLGLVPGVQQLLTIDCEAGKDDERDAENRRSVAVGRLRAPADGKRRF